MSVTEHGQQMKPVVVLGKAATADLAITEDPLYVPEGSLHFGTNASFDFFGFQFVASSFIGLPGRLAMNQETFPCKRSFQDLLPPC